MGRDYLDSGLASRAKAGILPAVRIGDIMSKSSWDATLAAASTMVPGIKVVYKRDVWLQRALMKIVFWTEFGEFWSGVGRRVYVPDRVDISNPRRVDVAALQHELTHVIDSCTYFGLLPFLPWWLNTFLFSVTYLLLLPWPGVGRGIAEMRAYRRDVENNAGRPRRWHIEAFRGRDYLFMLWPLPKSMIESMLKKPSPYGGVFPSL